MKAVLQSKGGNEKARENLKLWAANKCWQILLSSRVWSWAHSGQLEDSYQDFRDFLREDFYSLFSCSLFALHLQKTPLKNTPNFDDGWNYKRFIRKVVWRKIYTPPSFISAMYVWCLYSSLWVWMASDCSKDAGAQPGLFWFLILIKEGVDFCCLVFWIIFSSCPEPSTPCKTRPGSLIFIYCLRLFCMSLIFFLLSTVYISTVSLHCCVSFLLYCICKTLSSKLRFLFCFPSYQVLQGLFLPFCSSNSLFTSPRLRPGKSMPDFLPGLSFYGQ